MENIKVAVRIRPRNNNEVISRDEEIWNIDSSTNTISTKKNLL